MDAKLISYYIGIFIVFASHVWLLVQSKKEHGMLVEKCGEDVAKASSEMVMAHSGVNILAGCLIAYYFLVKENML
jgi:hypothetical protein